MRPRDQGLFVGHASRPGFWRRMLDAFRTIPPRRVPLRPPLSQQEIAERTLAEFYRRKALEDPHPAGER